MNINFKPDLSVVIPVYNSSKSLVELCEKINEQLKKTNRSHEIILVDDNSTNPQTQKAIKELLRKGLATKAYRHDLNAGQHTSLLTGIYLARGRYIITMDDDMQHDPGYLQDLLDKSSHDVVMADFALRKHNTFKNLTSVMKFFTERVVLNRPKDIRLSTYTVIKRDIALKMLRLAGKTYTLGSLIFKSTKDVVNTPVPHNPRKEGHSGYSLSKMFRLYRQIFESEPHKLGLFFMKSGLSMLIIMAIIIFIFYDHIAANDYVLFPVLAVVLPGIAIITAIAGIMIRFASTAPKPFIPPAFKKINIE
ncbi:MAG: glycosyltransferase family 2 protein [Candidatus Kapaibacterium sp.]